MDGLSALGHQGVTAALSNLHIEVAAVAWPTRRRTGDDRLGTDGSIESSYNIQLPELERANLAMRGRP